MAEGSMPMTDIEKAKRLFQESGLAFPTIPEELAARLKEQGEWIFAAREGRRAKTNSQERSKVQVKPETQVLNRSSVELSVG